MLICRVECVGVSPLLFNRMPQEFTIRRRPHTTFSEGDVASVQLYRDDRGTISLPTFILRRDLQRGARTRIKVGDGVKKVVSDGRGKRGRARRESFERAITFNSEMVALRDPTTGGPVSWKVYRAHFLGREGEPIDVIRPQIDQWSFSVLISVEPPHQAERAERLHEVFQKTGDLRGLGWQPREEHVFGRFRVVAFQTTNADVA